MKKLKNNKGISLASVLITVVLMIIILSSIIYSNSRTNEIKKAMLINSDIEELTKKVEMYYLEKGTLPLLEDDYSNYNYKTTTESGTNVIYYKLQISLLDNLNLNNKENIQINNSLTENDQWYVINKQTHTIYFVKYINGEVIHQTAAYSNKYPNIISQAESNGIFNTTGIGSSVNNTIELTPVTDSTSDVSGGLDVRDNGNSMGDSTNPGETSGSGNAYNGVFDYVGYEAGWTPGDTATNLVLHYDGEYNKRTVAEDSTVTLSHDTTISTWSDLSGNGNDGNLVSGNSWTSQKFAIYYNTSWSVDKRLRNTSIILENSRTPQTITVGNNNFISLRDNKYIVSYNKKNIPYGTSEYTIEIVFRYDDTTNASGGLVGMGTYNNVTAKSTYSDHAINLYKYQIFRRCVEDRAILDKDDTDLNNKSNAIRLNSEKNGIVSYYWGTNTDIDTGNIDLSNGNVYTVTVKYDSSDEKTKIFVNGVKYKEDGKTPNTRVKEITVGATNLNVDGGSWAVYSGDDHQYTYTYKEFLNSSVYSVRIYNRALTDTEINQNYIIDNIRFGSGR